MPIWRRAASWVLLLAATFVAIPAVFMAGSVLSERGLTLVDKVTITVDVLLKLGFPAFVLLVLAKLVRR
jgi:hypothetical protein